MPRILSWNIERFGFSKFLQRDGFDVNLSKYRFVVSTIRQVDPDVIVLIEVQTSGGGFGGLINGPSGPPGVSALLFSLRRQVSAAWCVVPPVILADNARYNEGIAVLYRSDRLAFSGPYMWNGQNPVPVVAGGAAAYPALWQAMLPNRPSIFPGLNENVLAGRLEFTANNQRILFPDALARSIWQTQFQEIAVPNPRLLNLFAMHAPPVPPLPRVIRAFQALAQVPEIVAPLAANELRVVLGDFNLNWLAGQVPFWPLTNNPPFYIPMIPAPTLIAKVLKASPHGPPPYYGYIQLEHGRLPLAIDNAFIQSGAGFPLGAQSGVIDRIVGIGMPGITRAMTDSINFIRTNFPAGAAAARVFRNIANYGKIGGGRGTSDHLPIVVNIP